MATFNALAKGNKTFKDTANTADIYNIGADAVRVTIAGKMKAGDVINVEGLASEYTVKASGRTITLKSDTQTITFQLDSATGAAAVRFLDGELSASFNGKAAMLGTQKLAKKFADVNDAALGASDSSAAIDAAYGNGGGSSGGSSTTFNLTSGVDAGGAFVGTSGNDTFNANVAVNPADGIASIETLTVLDEIDGGAGNDTLNYYTVGATALPAATIKNIENINMVSDGAATANVSTMAEVTSLSVKATGGAASLTTKSNVTAATVTGTATTVAISDSGTAATTADKLTTASITGATDNITIGSDVFTTLNLTKTTDGNATITAAAGARALTVTLNDVTGPNDDVVITDDEATTLVVKTTGAASSAIDLQADKATSVTIDADEKLTIAAVDLSAAKTITINGDSLVTFTTNTATDLGALESVSSAASSGGVTLTTALATGVVFTGGAGKDTITVGATTKSINTGAGDDKVTVAGVSALGSGGAIEGGNGTDTLAFSTFANAVTASAATTFAGTVSGFEKLELSGANGTDGATVDLANLDDIKHVVYSATNTKDSVLSNLASGGAVEITADQTATEGLVVNVKNASTGTADVLNLTLSKSASLAAVEVTAANVETVNINSVEDATTLAGTLTHALTLSATAAKSLNISGNAGVTFGTLTGATEITSIDASGVATGLVSLTTAALANAATIKGGAGANTIVATAATKAVTYTGGAKVDTVTINNAQDNSITTGAGDDVIVVGTGKNVVNAGDGDDSITVGAGLSTVTGGAGNDTLVIGATATNGNTYATFADASVGDKIDLSALTTEAAANGALGAKIALGDTAAFADYLAAATATVIGDAGASLVKWFQFGGNTYIVVDTTLAANTPDDTNGFENGLDSVVKLTGNIDLSKSTLATDVLTIVAA